MRNIWTIAVREYKHFFISPIAYVLMVVIFLVTGGFFFLDIYYAAQTQQFVPSMDRTFQLLVFPLFFLAIPAITMRTISEENRSGTIELLLTAPLADWQLIIGKWLGSFLFFLTVSAITLIYPAILNRIISPGIDVGMLISGYLGMILLISAMCAIGVFASSLFSNQIAAFITTLGIIIILWVIGAPAQMMQNGGGAVLNYLSLSDHFYSDFLVGMVTLGGVLYYLSVTALGLFLGTVTVETRRWR